jgi:hypothetical protein
MIKVKQYRGRIMSYTFRKKMNNYKEIMLTKRDIQELIIIFAEKFKQTINYHETKKSDIIDFGVGDLSSEFCARLPYPLSC